MSEIAISKEDRRTQKIIRDKLVVEMYENNSLISETDVSMRTCCGNEQIVSFTFSGNRQVMRIYDFLYKDATIYLERKKKKFEIIKGRLKTKSQKSSEYKDGIKLESRKAS